MESQLLKGLLNQGQKPVDNIPAKLTENEFVIPADVVLVLGNGNPEMGAKALQAFVDKVRSSTKSKE